jgi:O-acetyl-ADP-ribose deacetylase (regulator of RNase III)
MNQVLRESTISSGRFPLVRLQIVGGDITMETVDAIVNAANNRLQHGGGVAGVIVRAAGPVIQRESDRWVQEHGPVSHAEPAVTSSGRLPCKYVIHAVGPVWGEGHEDDKLTDAVRGSLQVADRLRLETIALPALSTGIFGFPKARAARVILAAIRGYLETAENSRLSRVRLVLFDPPSVEAFLEVFDLLFPDSEVEQP